MAKISCLVLLGAVVVAVSWAQADAKPWKREATSSNLLIDSREIRTFAELNQETREILAKEMLASLILLTVDPENSAEVDELTLALKKAAEKKWDRLGDYASYITALYEKSTGHPPSFRKD